MLTAPTYANAVLETALDAHADKIASFNAIGELSEATITSTKVALDGFADPTTLLYLQHKNSL